MPQGKEMLFLYKLEMNLQKFNICLIISGFFYILHDIFSGI